MLKIHLTPEAVQDLETIFEFTLLEWGYKKAEKYQDNLYDDFLRIAENPEIGSLYYFKEGDYRKLNCNKHLIFYRTEKRKCIIVRILHERVDLKTKLE